MKFVTFSPMTMSSAIGRVNLLVLEALQAQGHEAVVVRTEDEPWLRTPHQPCPVPVLCWNDGEAVAAAIRDADQLVYQIGDNHPFHVGAVHWLGIVPGIVCLHDFFIANLFHDWFRGRRDEAGRVLSRWYGEAATTDFYEAASGREMFDKAARLYPMTEWVGAMAQGVISHSRWGMDRVARSCAGPARVAALPYDAPGAWGANADPRPNGPVRLLTVGHANPNKRIETVIRVIGANPVLRSRITYRICGAIDPSYALSLAALARALQVELLIGGPTDSQALQQAINEADIVCCLRWPSLEAASASTAEAMLYGKAVIVTDTRFYSELPTDCVRKIAPEQEGEDLGAALEFLCEQPEERVHMGQRARAWAEGHFRPDLYAQHLADMARLCAMAAPSVSMARGFVAQLESWGATPRLLDACALDQALAIFDDQAPKRSSPPAADRTGQAGMTKSSPAP